MNLPRLQPKGLAGRISQGFVKGCRRFPLSILLLFCWAVGAILLEHLSERPDKNQYIFQLANFFVPYFFPTMTLLVTAFALDRERNHDHPLKRWAEPLACVAWVAVCVIIDFRTPFVTADYVLIITLVVALVVTMMTLPFRRSEDDRLFWRFVMGAVVAAIVAVAGAEIFFAGLQLLTTGLRELFGLSFHADFSVDLLIVCTLFVAPVIWLQMLPSLRSDDTRPTSMPRFLSGLMHFLFMPLTGAYLLTLYVYLVKIIVTWTLPQGMVSWLVTALMAGTIVILFCLYPTHFEEGHRFDRAVTRWLPIVTLPLLILMTIGIVRRFCDYGITVPRLYLLTFNLWCYGVCLWLIRCKGRRMIWIPVSFAGALFVTSVGPQNYCRLTKAILKSEIRSALKGTHMPLNTRTCQGLINSSDANKHKAISKLQYLTENYRPEDVADLVDSTAFSGMMMLQITDSVVAEYIYVYGDDYPVISVKGYASMVDINTSLVKATLQNNLLTMTIPLEANGIDRNVRMVIPMQELRKMGRTQHATKPIVYQGNALYIKALELTLDEGSPSSITLKGFLLTKDALPQHAAGKLKN